MKTSFDVKTASWGERQGQNKVLLSVVADNTEAGLCVMPQPGPASCRLTLGFLEEKQQCDHNGIMLS